MTRQTLIYSNEHYYYLTSGSQIQENFPLPVNEVWEILSKKLSLLQKEHDLKIAVFLVLNNQFHLLLLTPKENISRIMYFLKKDTTRTMQKRSGRINYIFAGRYRWCLIRNEYDVVNAFYYISSLGGEDNYPYSTGFRGKLERIKTNDWPVPPQYPFSKEETESIRFALGKREFRYKKNKSNRPMIPNAVSPEK